MLETCDHRFVRGYVQLWQGAGVKTRVSEGTLRLRERLKQRDSVITMADLNDQVLGFTPPFPSFSSQASIRNWILHDLFIVPGERGQRAGDRLIERAGQLKPQTRATGIQHKTTNAHLVGRSLYECVGFTARIWCFARALRWFGGWCESGNLVLNGGFLTRENRPARSARRDEVVSEAHLNAA